MRWLHLLVVATESNQQPFVSGNDDLESSSIPAAAVGTLAALLERQNLTCQQCYGETVWWKVNDIEQAGEVFNCTRCGFVSPQDIYSAPSVFCSVPCHISSLKDLRVISGIEFSIYHSFITCK